MSQLSSAYLWNSKKKTEMKNDKHEKDTEPNEDKTDDEMWIRNHEYEV